MCLEHRLLCLEHRLALQSPCSALNMGIFWQKHRIGTKPPPSIRTPCSKTWTLPFSCRRPPIFPAHPYLILSSFRSPLPMSRTVPLEPIPTHPATPSVRPSPSPIVTFIIRSHPGTSPFITVPPHVSIPSHHPIMTHPFHPCRPCHRRRSWRGMAGATHATGGRSGTSA